MLRVMSLGLLAGLFFSTTFVLNRLMSLEGGHWFWSAALRYGYMLLLLGTGLLLFKGGGYLQRLGREFLSHWQFWVASGSIGFGGFYALICFAADFSPGWVVATTWQLTIIASLFVLLLFGRTFSPKIWFYSGGVFFGVLLVNLSQVEAMQLRHLLLGAIPVLGAAFCYPLGNQMVWEAQNGHPRFPQVDVSIVGNGFSKVLLLTLGSLPFWCILYLITLPPLPPGNQIVGTAVVALFSGVLATTLFLNARALADNAGKLAAVDATQSSEVIFALGGEIAFLAGALPNATGLAGIVITVLGLTLLVRHDHG